MITTITVIIPCTLYNMLTTPCIADELLIKPLSLILLGA
jgi:hypothetical protein